MAHRPLLIVLLVVAAAIAASLPASADPPRPVGPADHGDGGSFRRTTPRASLGTSGGELVLGIPASRAWGIESGLRPLPPPGAGSVISVVLAVSDPDVTGAFVRIAYYSRGDARSRQIAIQDSAVVRAGDGARLTVLLDPPAGAVAYRLRVLGRLAAGSAVSQADAIRARWVGGALQRPRERPAFTRLLSVDP